MKDLGQSSGSKSPYSQDPAVSRAQWATPSLGCPLPSGSIPACTTWRQGFIGDEARGDSLCCKIQSAAEPSVASMGMDMKGGKSSTGWFHRQMWVRGGDAPH